MEKTFGRNRIIAGILHLLTVLAGAVFIFLYHSEAAPGTMTTEHISGELFTIAACLIILGSLNRSAGETEKVIRILRCGCIVFACVMLAEIPVWFVYGEKAEGVKYWMTLWYAVPMAILAFIYAGLLQWTQLQNQKLENSFNRLMSRDIASRLTGEEDPALAGGIRRVTILFCRIHELEERSRGIENTKILRSLRVFYSQTAEILEKHHGTVLEFPGHCVLAVFGAMEDGEPHETYAVQAAMEIQKELREYALLCEATGLPVIAAGIGINTGNAHVGNIGDERQKRFTVLGSQVNMASRIENYTGDGEILISESVRAALPSAFLTEEAGKVLPKGVDTEVGIYRVKAADPAGENE